MPFIKNIALVSELPQFLACNELLGPDDSLLQQSNSVFLSVKKDNKIGYCFMTMTQFKKYFPKVNVINGVPCAATCDSKFRLNLPVETPLGQLYYSNAL